MNPLQQLQEDAVSYLLGNPASGTGILPVRIKLKQKRTGETPVPLKT
jgi:hypothetical protein